MGLASCSDVAGPSAPADDSITLTTISGTVDLPDGCAVDPAGLTVFSLAQPAAVTSGGSFSVLSPETGASQVLVVADDSGAPVLLGYVDAGETGDVTIDAGSTAKALVAMNPFLTMFSANDRETVVAASAGDAEWPHLVDSIESALVPARSHMEFTLDAAILQRAASISIRTLQSYPSGALMLEGPWIEDGPGNAILCVNPGASHWAVSIRPVAGGDETLVLADSDREAITVYPAWPPLLSGSSRTTTPVTLDDGSFSVSFTMGNFRNYDTATANGLASTANLGRAIEELLALAVGVAPGLDPSLLDAASCGAVSVGDAVAAADPYAFIERVLELIADHPDAVAGWWWADENADGGDYLAALAPIVSGIAFSVEGLAGGEWRVPFFGSVAVQASALSASIEQTDGVVTVTGTNHPPVAAFEHEPAFVSPGEVVSFDARATSDPDGPESVIEVRWDWENDGVWDTEWRTTKTAQHTFATAGAKEVALEVREPRGLSGSVVHVINVGGGGATASHIIVFRDVVPWAPELPPVLDQMLEVMEFTEGPGERQYEIVTSAGMSTCEMTPGEDLVIIQSDQPQSFYNGYEANQIRFLDFVSRGGTIFWEACDMGWHGGSLESAGIVLPGAVQVTSYESYYNYVVLPGAPLVEGLPSMLYGQHASHGRMRSLPGDATVYVTDEHGDATLVEYPCGDGWVVMTTQPLEWNFYHDWSAGQVMPHVVGYVTGVPLVYDFGDIVKPGLRGGPRARERGRDLTSGMR